MIQRTTSNGSILTLIQDGRLMGGIPQGQLSLVVDQSQVDIDKDLEMERQLRRQAREIGDQMKAYWNEIVEMLNFAQYNKIDRSSQKFVDLARSACKVSKKHRVNYLTGRIENLQCDLDLVHSKLGVAS